MDYVISEYLGQKIWNVTVIGVDPEYVGKTYNANHWLFQCDCGNTFSASPSRVISGHKKSCGCRKLAGTKTHGCNGDEFYPTWYAMMQRCHNPSHHKYKDYGARGISVCEEWKSPKAFIEWARATIGSKKPGYTLDRYDNNSDYSPENCHWATPTEQARNRRSNRIVTLKGESKPFKVWCDEFGISDAAVRQRLKLGWAYEDAFMTPVSKDHTRSTASAK